MLPTLTTFSEATISRFLFLGLDLYEVQRDGRELFVPFNGKLNKTKKYFLTCDDEDVVEMILTSKRCAEFMEKMKVGIVNDDSGYFTSLCLRPFTKANLLKFLNILQNETKSYK